MFKILVVEDDHDLNRTVCAFLNRSGYEATGCLNATDAYDALYKTMFDLIVSDIMMPGIDGFEFATNVRALNENIPILFMTAKDDIASKQRGFRIGVDDYMVKPIDLDELFLRIGALLRRAKIASCRKLEVGSFVMDMLSKTLTCAFAMACMCVTYLIGAVLAGLLTGLSFEVHFGSLLCALLGKIIMSLGWASLYTFLNIIFRKYFGISIASSFFFGTGILIIGAAAILGNSSVLNLFLYGSSVYACLTSNLLTVLVCAVVSVSWTVVYTLAGTLILSKSDVY